MDENLTNQTRHRISGKPVSSGRVSNPSAHPEQNGGFSDGFPTKSPVDACHFGQPGKSSDPKNPMKSIDYPPSEGYPAHPPSIDCWAVCAAIVEFMGICAVCCFVCVAGLRPVTPPFVGDPSGIKRVFCRGFRGEFAPCDLGFKRSLFISDICLVFNGLQSANNRIFLHFSRSFLAICGDLALTLPTKSAAR